MSASPAILGRALDRVCRGEDLGAEEARGVADVLLDGPQPVEIVGPLLKALAEKGESEEELLAFARALRSRSRPFPGPSEAGAVDLCGTGGAATPSFNLSTVSAFVVAATGVPVAKHGNVSARGPCGSSDLLEALGLPVRSSVEFAEACWRAERLCFLHAPLYHVATRNVATVRKALGCRTIFNQLGPLTNPAGVRTQLVGSYSKEYARLAVRVLERLGGHRLLAVHSENGMDELSSLDQNWTLQRTTENGGREEEGMLDPGGLLEPGERKGNLSPRSPIDSARLAHEVLRGQGDGAVRGAVLLTAGAMSWLLGRSTDLREGVVRARGALEDGSAHRKLERLEAIARSKPWGGA